MADVVKSVHRPMHVDARMSTRAHGERTLTPLSCKLSSVACGDEGRLRGAAWVDCGGGLCRLRIGITSTTQLFSYNVECTGVWGQEVMRACDHSR